MIDSIPVVLGVVALGVAAGMLGGLLGLGGGVLFVPGLVIFLGLSQHHAEATSLLAIVPVALVGALIQDRYGNVRRGDALQMGVLSVAGVAGGVVLANVLSGAALRTTFALLMLLIAGQLVRRTLAQRGPTPAEAAEHSETGSGRNIKNDPGGPEEA